MPSARRTPRLTALALVLLALVISLITLAPAPAHATDILKLADPSTSQGWVDLFGDGSGALSYSTGQSGRIWADKSVYGSSEDARAAGLPVSLEDEEHGFIVSLSALSSAASFRHEEGLAHDVVLVVPLNRLLVDRTYAGRAQAAHLADALNAAIARLMAENGDGSTPTRVSVIGYSSDVATLMPLSSYEPDDQGRYVSFVPATSSSPAELKVVAHALDPGVETRDGSFGAGLYLQRAAYVAGESLAAAADDEGVTGRAPVMVLVSLEAPSMASVRVDAPPAYTGDQTGFLGPLPNSRETGYGTDAPLATMLTVRLETQRVGDAWRAAGAGGDLELYTTGLDTTDMAAYLLETAGGQESATLEDTVAGQRIDLAENLREAARAYGEAAAAGEKSVSLELVGSSGSGLVSETVELPVVDGLVSADDGYALSSVDEYLSARSARALSWTLDTVVDRMLDVEYDAPTSGGEGSELPGGSRVSVRDRVGAGMLVGRVDGIVYGDELLDGALAAQAVQISLSDPFDVEATHEFAYLVSAVNARYHLGGDAYGLFYDALSDRQIHYDGETSFSNRASWYVDADHGMVAGDGLPYRFARTDEVDAIANGTWEQADASVRSRVEAARAAGATAVCETYFYIGNLENQYTGGDVALYDFVVMVETDLSDGRQTLLLSAPVEAVPARRANVTVHEDGSATMTLEDSGDAWPVRLVYEVQPTAPVEALLERIEAGGTVSNEELAQAMGADVVQTASGGRLLYASAFDGDGASSEAGSVASAWVAPGNSYYSFAHDAPLFSLKNGQTLPASGLPAADQLEPLTTRPVPGATYYYAKTVYDATLTAPGEAEPAAQRTVFLPYVAPDEASQEGRLAQGPDGQWLALAGTLKHLVPVELGSHEKVTNVTGSAPYAERLSIEQTRDDGIHLQVRLGNNGLLVLPPQTGSAELVVEKSLDGGRHELTDSERAQTFAFDVSLSRADGAPLEAPVLLTGPSGEAELVTPENGLLELSLADGQSARISGIPAGTSFSVSERPVPGFSPSVEVEGADGGSSSGDDAATGTLAIGTTTARFTNTKQVGALVVGKTVAGNAADQARAFPFDVTLDRAGGLPESLPYELRDAAGTTLARGTATVSEDGSVALEEGREVALVGGQELALLDVPVGTSYDVSETDEGDYEVDASGAGGTIESDGQTAQASFTNSRMAYGSLSVEKHVVGGDPQREFEFTVTLVDGEGGEPLSGEVTYEVDGTGGTADLDASGSFMASLADGQELALDKLPQGTAFEVREKDYADEGYLTIASGERGVIGDEPVRASFTNVSTSGTLGIAKVVAGNAADSEATFDFTVQVKGLPSDSTYGMTRYSSDGTVEKSETIAFDADGTATVDDLHGGEGVLIGGLPERLGYTVTEQGAEGYVTYAGSAEDIAQGVKSTSCSGTIAGDGTASAAYFLNVLDLHGSLTIESRISGAAAEDEAAADRSFSYAVEAATQNGSPVTGELAYELDDGTTGTAVFVNGRAVIDVPSGGSLTFGNFPAGCVRVTQVDASAQGYVTTPSLSQDDVVSQDERTTLTFINEKSYAATAWAPDATSALVGRAQATGEFAYQLACGDEIVASAASVASPDGMASALPFPELTLDRPGAHKFLLSQAVPANPETGVSYDRSSFVLEVDVTADALGRLSVSETRVSLLGDDGASEPVPAADFVNRYETRRAIAPLTARKTLVGGTLAEGQFSFRAQEVDGNGEPVGNALVARNQDNGTVDFGQIVLDVPMGGSTTRTFLVTEDIPEQGADGVEYDESTYRLTVTARDDGTTDEVAVSTATELLSEDGWVPCDEVLFENRVSGGGTTDPEDPDEPTGPDEPAEPSNPESPEDDSSQQGQGSPQATPDTSDASVGPDVLIALALLGVAVAAVAYVLRRRS